MFCRILLIAATYLTLVYPAGAQSQAVQPKDGQGWVSIDFPGGSLADYVDLLHKSCPELNVVVNSDAADLAIQPIELRNVRPESTIAILERLYPQQLDVSGLGGEFSVVVIGCVDSDSAGFRTEIVSIRGLLEGPHGIPLDQIMAVIESAPQPRRGGSGHEADHPGPQGNRDADVEGERARPGHRSGGHRTVTIVDP